MSRIQRPLRSASVLSMMMMMKYSNTPHITTGMLGRNMAELGVARKLLWTHKAVIVNELDVSRVLPTLVRKGVFNYAEEREILSSSDALFRADMFVDRLSTKGPGAFGHFCTALELTHPSLLTRFLLHSTLSDQIGKLQCYFSHVRQVYIVLLGSI